MSPAAASLGALLLAIAVSCVTDVNVGIIAMALAWIVGVYVVGLSLGEVLAGFPAQLFLTLIGVTLLFGAAQANGTLDRVARQAVRLCRGNRGLIPIMFFGMALILSSIGPGNIAAAALVAPLAMRVAGSAAIPAFLMAIMVGSGASAGSLSPFAPAGIIANETMMKAGMPDAALENYANNAIAHLAVALMGYLGLGGWRLLRDRSAAERMPAQFYTDAEHASPETDLEPLQTVHVTTLIVIAALIGSVILLDVNVGIGAIVGSIILTAAGASDERQAIALMPWRAILMVSGVTLLVSLLEKTGGVDLFAGMLARVSTPHSVTGVTAFFAALISIYSSTSGVVLPALLPTAPLLAERIGVDPLGIASSINVGAHLVDVSPLSTIGALCLAAAPASEDGRMLFNKMLAWGIAMAFVSGALCWLFFGVLQLS